MTLVSELRPTVAFLPDTGSGGRPGAVPGPATGDAARFLRGDATFVNVNLQTVYDNSPAAPTAHIAFNTTQGGFHMDGASLAAGAAGTAGPDYMLITRGAVNVLNTSYNATDFRATVYSSAINGLDIAPDPGIFPDRAVITVVPDRLIFLRQDRTYTPLNLLGSFSWDSTLTKAGGSYGGFIGLNGQFQFSTSASGFGMGNAILHGATWKNTNGAVANLGPAFLFANNAVYQADGASITTSQARIFFDNSTYNVINAGVLIGLGVGHNSFWSQLRVDSGATLALRQGMNITDTIGTGVLTAQVGVNIASLTFATTNIAIRSAVVAGATNFFLQGNGTAISTFAGDVHINNSVALVLGTVAANRVELERTAAGAFRMRGIGGTNNESLIWSFDTAPNVVAITTDTSAIVSFDLGVRATGVFEHTGATLGIFSTTPVAQPAAYTISNPVVRRTIDISAFNLQQVGELLGTLALDVQSWGGVG